MSVIITQATVRPWSFLLPTPVRGLTHRRGWHLVLTDEVGRTGVGDAAPWVGRASGSKTTETALNVLANELVGSEWSDAPSVLMHDSPEATMAVGQAVLSLLGQRQNRGLADLLWPSPKRTVSTSALVATPAEAIAAQARGVRTLKIKVGTDAAASVAPIRAVAPTCRIRLDANGAWSVADAQTQIRALVPFDIEFLEQPVEPGDLDGLAACRGLGIPIAADESISQLTDLIRVIDAGAADIAVIKPMFLGGLRRAQTIAAVALDAGLGVVVSSALESAVGLDALIALASGLPASHALGLGSGHAGEIAVAVEGYPNPIRSAALADPDGLALVCGPQRLTYAELEERVARHAAAMAHEGVGPGHRVGLSAGPRGAHNTQVDWVVAAHATMWLGAELAPLPPVPDESAAIESGIKNHVVASASLPGTDRQPERFWPAHETRVVIQTTGSTGQPKVVRLTTEQLVTSALASATRLGLQRTDRWIACLPLHHIGGLQVLLRSAIYGTAVILMPRFDAVGVMAAIDDGATLVSLVPNMLRHLVERYENTRHPVAPRLRAILVGGGPTPASLVARADRIGLPIRTTWGFTEAASQVATASSDGDMRALPGGRVSSEAGRLCVRGPIVGGTLLSNDRGSVDRGVVTVDGRADDIIVSGGLNLDPIEIEDCLLRHPDISAAVVVGIAHPDYGMRPASLLVSGERASRPSTEALRAWCRSHLVKPKCPDLFIWTSELPLRGPGKIDRRAAALQLGELASQPFPLSEERA
ncbi:MAG: O-succinylbenzoic acid--CoA ligase [Myxococcota bacterium]